MKVVHADFTPDIYSFDNFQMLDSVTSTKYVPVS